MSQEIPSFLFLLKIDMACNLRERNFTMKRWTFIALLVSGIVFCNAAQSQLIKCNLTYIGDESCSAMAAVYVGKVDCTNKKATYVVTGAVGTPFDVYIGQCDLAIAKTTTITSPTCQLIDSSEIIGADGAKTIEIAISDLVEDYGQSCFKSMELTIAPIIYYSIPLSTALIRCESFLVNTQGPSSAPTNVKGEPEENAIRVSWDYSGNDAEKYRVYYQVIDDCQTAVDAAKEAYEQYSSSIADNDAGADAGNTAELTKQFLEEMRQQPENVQEIVFGPFNGVYTNSQKITLVNKVKSGEGLAIRVAAVDNADNEGFPSETICVQAIDTNGFGDEAKHCKCGCSIERIADRRAPIGFFIIVAVLALVWADRRKRS
jgi:hypothetical protein